MAALSWPWCPMTTNAFTLFSKTSGSSLTSISCSPLVRYVCCFRVASVDTADMHACGWVSCVTCGGVLAREFCEGSSRLCSPTLSHLVFVFVSSGERALASTSSVELRMLCFSSWSMVRRVTFPLLGLVDMTGRPRTRSCLRKCCCFKTSKLGTKL